ncbi:hypothetical protein H4Q26_015459 [Puccinia striiformis f. sp. tritici PST-130]|nr:hypothetical protein H4Q26_015459 [Puccinia striiformis f. sp. tritici PST-130]
MSWHAFQRGAVEPALEGMTQHASFPATAEFILVLNSKTSISDSGERPTSEALGGLSASLSSMESRSGFPSTHSGRLLQRLLRSKVPRRRRRVGRCNFEKPMLSKHIATFAEMPSR